MEFKIGNFSMYVYNDKITLVRIFECITYT